MNTARPPALAFSCRRVGVLAGQAWVEAVRQRVFQFTTVLAAALVLGSLGLRELDCAGAETRFVTDFGHGALVLFGSVLTILLSVHLLSGELEDRTLLPVLARPLRRSEVICGKFLGAWGVLLLFCAVVTGALVLALQLGGPPGAAGEGEAPAVAPALSPLALVLANGGLQAVKFGLLTAMMLLLASYARSALFAQGTGFLVLVICHLQYLARDAWAMGEGWWERVGGGFLGLVFPNFQLFNGDAFAATGQWALGARIGLYGLAYTAVFLALAVWSFRRREL